MKHAAIKNANNFIRVLFKSILLQAFLLTVLEMPAVYGHANSADKDSTHVTKNKKFQVLTIQERLQVFYPVDSADYSVKVCVDVPDNHNPERVYVKGEPGHVFLILTKRNPLSGEVITQSFGFYPRLPVSCLFKQTRSKILDNSNREYDASIEKKLTMEEFAFLLRQCIELSKRKYNLKKFNCYDYVLQVFNSLPGIEKLPVTKVRFPFIFGRGGSPCGLYRDLKKLMTSGSSWSPYINFGLSISPGPDPSQNSIMSFK
ncbi:MAG: hypothetical protein ABJA78_19525 [Ferruginibacter sp.]